ncbi:MAG: hypothetical protein L6R42_003505 [Xanthoria sp. 1 TBL-2021]|nr:MAG: hypothetical protein L6R42_003505 [Xanthoria sp. 1 TBL-2021]
MFSFLPCSKFWSRRPISHSTIHGVVQATIQDTNINRSDEGSLIKPPSRDIAHSRIHGVVQAVLQGDEEEEEEEEAEEEEWISVSLPITIPEEEEKKKKDEEEETEADPQLHNTETIRRWIERMTTATEDEHQFSCTTTHIGKDETIVRDMLAMLSRLQEQSRELETKMESCEGGFMYSDPWVIREREEMELRERVVFLLRRVLYALVLEDDVDR